MDVATQTLDATAWSASGRVGYAYVGYDDLQQGTRTVANPSELAIGVHLGTAQLVLAAPTRTSLDLQLPFGSLVTRSLTERRTDHGIGDLELRVRQGFASRARISPSIALGAVVPTGDYVERSGAANLPPEASYLTLGRGVPWGIAELDARAEATPRVAGFAQVSARVPLARTRDEFAWGTELRTTLGAQVARVAPRLSLVVTTDLQWRDGASEPDPFSMARLPSANAGGWQWSGSPAVAVDVPGGVSVMAGVRVPLWIDVTGNQLVPGVGAFVAASYAHRIAPARARRTASSPPVDLASRMITVVDYWATWCAPCERIGRALDAAAGRWTDVRIVKVDASAWPGDGAPELPAGVTGLPVVEIFDRDGRRARLLVGEDALRVVEEVDTLRATSAGTAGPDRRER